MNIIENFGMMYPVQRISTCSHFDGMMITAILLIIIIAAWTLFWKALALWHAAKSGDKIWFIALLFINTLGILEIIYLYFVAKVKICSLCSCSDKCDCKECGCEKKKK